MVKKLKNIEHWVFDLDNTLYPATNSLFPQVGERIREFVERCLNVDAEQAHKVQKKYYQHYGTTLKGLMENHKVDAKEYLDYVHDIDFSVLKPNKELFDALSKLKGNKFIYTNATAPYSEKILSQLGIRDFFERIFDIHSADLLPKPHMTSYEMMLNDFKIKPVDAIMVEDMSRNLVPAQQIGMKTAWIANDLHGHKLDEPGEHIDYHVDHLEDWLNSIHD